MKQILTKNKQHETKAIGFIDGVIKESNLSYSQLMCHLENKKDDWKNESLALSFINLFDMTSEQYDRKNYLSALILYAEKLLIKFRLNCKFMIRDLDKFKSQDYLYTNNAGQVCNPSHRIHYGNCNKLNKSVTFVPNICQIETQKCFEHRRL